MSRLIRGVAALVTLVLGLVGVPWALVLLGGNPVPASLSWSVVVRALLTPDDGKIVLGLITFVGWLAWLVFAFSVVAEVVHVVSRRRIRIKLPGLGAPQRLAAGLLISVIAMLAVPQVADAPVPAPTVTAPTVTAPTVTAPTMTAAAPVLTDSPAPPLTPRPLPGPEVDPAGAVGIRSTTHVVKPGDDLWSLAQHYYGHGQDWRKIATANPDVLSGGPDRLRPGWRLVIPDMAASAPGGHRRVARVRRGDTLSAIAQRELGSAEHWKKIYQLNRAQLNDPDNLEVGIQLVLPAPEIAPTRGIDEDPAPKAKGAPPRPHPRADGSARPGRPSGASASARPTEPPAGPSEAPGQPVSAGPTTHHPATQTPTSKASTSKVPATQAPASASSSGGSDAPEATAVAGQDLALPLTAVGGLLAAGLLGGLAVRRRIQLQGRPIGRRIAQPPPAARAVEVALGRRQRPLSLRTLDRATRAIAAHCRLTRCPLPSLLYALVGDEEIELVMAQPSADAPVGFTVRGRSWLLGQADANYLSSVPGLSDSGRPWPALVSLGRDARDRLVVADLEAIGLLQVRSDQPQGAEEVLAAMAVELSFSPWADELILTLVGSCAGLPAALGKHNVTRTDDVDGLLDRLERRAAVQRTHLPEEVVGQHRIDPDLSDPWAPEIVMVNALLSPDQQRRLSATVSAHPRVTMSAVVTDPSVTSTWLLHLTGSGGQPAAVLQPAGLRLTPQRLDPPTVGSVLELIDATGSELTTTAPWWTDVAVPPDPPPDHVRFTGTRLDSWGITESAGQGAGVMTVTAGVRHPTLQLLGPIELVDPAGDPPSRAGRQCLEYCAWLLENPGTTAQAMAAALVVAEGTRRSNMSRLRGWLGSDLGGQAYLPDAYTGRIMLHAGVSSDWQQLQILTGPGVNRAGSQSLRTALDLVRGAPLADAAPGQWHWAEELRTDMISCLRDIGVELATRALRHGDLDLARWAAARALVAAPGDELLMAARIRTEHLAGNTGETERLTLQLAAQSRALGVDLDDDTVILLQQVMEGRVRARMA